MGGAGGAGGGSGSGFQYYLGGRSSSYSSGSGGGGGAIGGSSGAECRLAARGVSSDEPATDLVKFVLGAWSFKTGLAARACKWSEDATTGKLTLALGPENRWCAHVQRAHRSNGTLLRIDRQRARFAQFCYDPDCRAAGFRGSDELPIPHELCGSANQVSPCVPSALSTTGRDAEGEPNQQAEGEASGWLLSEGVLADLPLEEMVAAHRRCARAHAQSQGGRDGVPSIQDDQEWRIPDEALYSLEGV